MGHHGELHRCQGEDRQQYGDCRQPLPPSGRDCRFDGGGREDAVHFLLRLELRLAIGQQVGHLAGGLEAGRRVFRVQFGHDAAQPLRHLRDHLADRPRLVLRDALQDRERVARPERWAAGGHHVEHAAEAEQVGPVIERIALGLLGGHVHRRPGHHAATRQAGVVGGAGQAEVGDLDVLLRAGLDQHVGRLDVPVDQIRRVGSGQTLGDLPADAQHLRHLQRPDAVEALLKGLPGDELHDQIRQRLFLNRIHLHDILVANLGGCTRLPQETLAHR